MDRLPRKPAAKKHKTAAARTLYLAIASTRQPPMAELPNVVSNTPWIHAPSAWADRGGTGYGDTSVGTVPVPVSNPIPPAAGTLPDASRQEGEPVLPTVHKPSTPHRPEAKRWCFTLNNPVLGDVFSVDHAIDPELYDYLVCGNERGEAGNHHLQGFVCFKNKMRLTAVKKVFERAHWEISKAKDLLRASNYCKKGEQSHEEWERLHEEGPNFGLNADFVEFGTLPVYGGAKANGAFQQALAAENADAALLIIAQQKARDYCLNRSQIEKNLKAHFHVPTIYKPRYTLDQFCHPPLCFSDKHATLVWGDTNLGKTAFVKAHFKNPLFIRHMDRLKELKLEHDAIIFDDMSFQHLPISTVIYLLDCDDAADIHVRYGVATIPANTVKVFTHNTSNPFYSATADASQIQAVERRYKSFHVGNKLFK